MDNKYTERGLYEPTGNETMEIELKVPVMDKYSNWPTGLVKTLETLRVIPNEEGRRANRMSKFISNYSGELDLLKERKEQLGSLLGRIENESTEAEYKIEASKILMNFYESTENHLVKYRDEIDEKISGLEEKGLLPDEDVLKEQKKVRYDIEMVRQMKMKSKGDYLRYSNAKESLEKISLDKKDYVNRLDTSIAKGDTLLDIIRRHEIFLKINQR